MRIRTQHLLTAMAMAAALHLGAALVLFPEARSGAQKTGRGGVHAGLASSAGGGTAGRSPAPERASTPPVPDAPTSDKAPATAKAAQPPEPTPEPIEPAPTAAESRVANAEPIPPSSTQTTGDPAETETVTPAPTAATSAPETATSVAEPAAVATDSSPEPATVTAVRPAPEPAAAKPATPPAATSVATAPPPPTPKPQQATEAYRAASAQAKTAKDTASNQPAEKATTTASTQTASTPSGSDAPSNVDPPNTASNEDKGGGPARDTSAGQGRGTDGTTTGKAQGGGAVGARQDYLARLRAWLERHKEYPRRARLRRLEGVVTLHLVIHASGKVLNAELAEGSGHASLDEAGLAMVAQAQPLPAMPESMDRDRLVLRVPVRFGLR